MRHRELMPTGAARIAIRAAGFEDVAGILRLTRRAIENGCRDHYNDRQRESVYLGYASSLFLETLGPFEMLVAEQDGRVAGVAQVDLAHGLLRALFVDPSFQGQGVGRTLLAAIEARARAAGRSRIEGAMSLNAVPFYTRAGFSARGGPERFRSALAWVPVLRMAKLIARTPGTGR